MKKQFKTIAFFLFLSIQSTFLLAEWPDEYRSVQTGDWHNTATWEYWDGSRWVEPKEPPRYDNAGPITVRSTHTVTITADDTVDQVVIENDATLIIDEKVILTVVVGWLAGIDISNGGLLDNKGLLQNIGWVRVIGTFRNSGEIKGSTDIQFHSTGVYQHNFTTTAGVIPEFEWLDAGATCEIIGYTTYTGAMDVEPQAFRNVVWNCEEQEEPITFHPNFRMVEDFTIKSTGTGSLRLHDGIGMQYIVNGNFRQENGMLVVGAYMLDDTLTIKGNAEFIGGIVGGTAPYGGDVHIMLGGTTETDLLVEDAYTFVQGFAGPSLIMHILDTSTRNLQKNTALDDAGLLLKGMLICNTFSITGPNFTMYPSSTLNIGSGDGIWNVGTNAGNIQTSTRNYEWDATYIYSISARSGDGIPDSVRRIEMINGAEVILEKSVKIKKELKLTSGVIRLRDGNDLFIGEEADITGTFNNNNMIWIEDVNTNLVKLIDALKVIEFPIGSYTSGANRYTPIQVKVASGTIGNPAGVFVTLDDIKHPNNYSKTNYLSRYWKVGLKGISNFTLDVECFYDDIDINGDETEIHGGFKPIVGDFEELGLVNTSLNNFQTGPIIEQGGYFSGVDLSDVIIRLNLKLFLQGAYR
ncbi:MAG: hypothetical protein JXA68_03050 [Ignavibacteriales bacterium]|nr:hypothetical protein [Ignavibacteriales bacterium]